MPPVTTHRGDGWTRFTVKEEVEPFEWLEGWIYDNGAPRVYASQCQPISSLPDNPAGRAIRAAMEPAR